MKPSLSFFILLLSGAFCAILFFYGFLGDPTWATVGITGILALITAYYAISTDKILTVSQKQLELVMIQQRSSKIEEIFKTVFIPLDKRIKEIEKEIKDKSDVYGIDLSKNLISIHSLIDDLRFLTKLEQIKSQLESIKVNENYQESIFQQHIKLIFECIEAYDIEQKNYQIFLNSTIIPLFQKVILPFIEKSLTPFRVETLFRLLVRGKLGYEMQRETILAPRFSNEYSQFIEDCYQNNIEFQTFIMRKSEHEEKLIKKLELLSAELNLLSSEWMNVYHFSLTSQDIHRV